MSYCPSYYFPGPPAPTPPPPSGVVLFREALVTALKYNLTLASIVAARIFPTKIPETQSGACLAYKVNGVNRLQNLSGPCGIADARVSFFCRSSNISDCDNIKEELRNLFDGSTATLSGIELLNVRSENEEDSYEEPVDDSDTGTFGISFDLVYRYREPVPTLS